jgi:hypothetical protein
MAKAKVVPSDIGSVEFDELRKAVHTLYLLIENALAAVTVEASDTATVQAVQTALVNIRTAITNGTYSGREVLGVIPKTKKHQAAQMSTNTVTLSISDKNY